MNEYEKHRRKKQLMNELQIKKMQDELSNSNSSLEENVSNANTIRKGLGEMGQSMSTSGNTKLANAGSNLYKFTGQQGLDALKNKTYSGIGKGVDALKGKVTSFKGNPNSLIGQSASNIATGTNSATNGLSSVGQRAGQMTGNSMAGTQTVANNLGTTANTAGKASKLAGGAGKGLGAIGAGFNAVSSANRISQGDTVGGILDGAKALSVLAGPYGWAIYAVAEIADMFNKAQKKKQQKAMNVAQEANTEAMMKQKEHQAEVMQDNAERKAEILNDIGTTNIDSNMSSNLDNMDEYKIDTIEPISQQTLEDEATKSQSEDEDSSAVKEGLLGTFRNELLSEMIDSPTLTESLGKQVGLDLSDVNSPGTIARDIAKTDKSITDDAKGMFTNKNTNKKERGGVMTGGASPVENYIDQIAEQQDYMKKNGFSEEEANGLRQGLNYGKKETADWIDQYNKGAGSKNPIKIPQTEQEIELAKKGQFNPVPQQASVDEKETFKDLLMKELGGALGDFSEGFKENSTTSFAPGNIMAEKMKDGRDKTFLNRAGEAFGTANRLLANPLLQGGLAGLAYGIDKGDALYGLGKGVEWAGNKAKSNMYAKELGQRPTILGNISADDYKAITTNAYRKQKLSQDGYTKLKKQAEDNLRSGAWSTKTYNDYIAELDRYYVNSQVATIGAEGQDSNQTRMANVAEGNLEERVRHNKVAEGQGQQRINLGIQTKADKEAEARQMNDDVVYYVKDVPEEHKPAMLLKLKDNYPDKFDKILKMINDYTNTTLPGSRKR